MFMLYEPCVVYTFTCGTWIPENKLSSFSRKFADDNHGPIIQQMQTMFEHLENTSKHKIYSQIKLHFTLARFMLLCLFYVVQISFYIFGNKLRAFMCLYGTYLGVLLGTFQVYFPILCCWAQRTGNDWMEIGCIL
jgi:hypothetical protein